MWLNKEPHRWHWRESAHWLSPTAAFLTCSLAKHCRWVITAKLRRRSAAVRDGEGWSKDDKSFIIQVIRDESSECPFDNHGHNHSCNSALPPDPDRVWAFRLSGQHVTVWLVWGKSRGTAGGQLSTSVHYCPFSLLHPPQHHLHFLSLRLSFVFFTHSLFFFSFTILRWLSLSIRPSAVMF